MKLSGLRAVVLLLAGMLAAGAVNAQTKGWYKTAAKAVMAAPLLVDLDDDGKLEIVVPAQDDKLYAWNADGTTFSPSGGSWPVTLGFSDGSIASVAAGDVDGDSDDELVVVGDDASALNAAVKVYEVDGSLLASLTLNSAASGKATPCLIDCYRYSGSTPHSGLEIIVRDGDGRVHIVYYSGSTLTDLYSSTYFDTLTDDIDKDDYGSQYITSSASALSLPADKTLIVVGSSDGQVHRWEVESTASNNWSVTTLSALSAITYNSTRFMSSPLLTDLDDDGDYELIAATTKRNVYVWDSSGTLLTNWPQATAHAVTASPAAVNLDQDSDLEILIGCDDGSVYAWNMDGSTLSAWTTLDAMGPIVASPVAAEIDGQAGLEIVAASLDGYLYAWHASNGAMLDEWPKRLQTQLYGAPAIGDLRGGGRMSIVVGGFDGKVFAWDLPWRSLDAAAGFRQFHANTARTGAL